jgi:hypothetical protein
MISLPTLPNVSSQPEFDPSLPNNIFGRDQNDSGFSQTFAPPNDSDKDYIMDDELLAFINSFTTEGESTSSHEPPPSSEGSIDQPLVTPDLSFDAQSFNLPQSSRGPSNMTRSSADVNSSDADFLAMLNSALLQGDAAPSASSQPQSFDHQGGGNDRGTSDIVSNGNGDGKADDIGRPIQQSLSANGSLTWPMINFQPVNGGPADLAVPPQLPGLFRSPLDLTQSQKQFDTGMAVTLPELMAGLGNAVYSSATQQPDQPPAAIYRQLPPLQTAYLQQMLGGNPEFAPPANPGQPQASTSSDAPPANQANNNMIDLSKPLNAHDVERILRALQDQQAKSSPTPPPSMSMQPRQHHQQQQQPSKQPGRSQIMPPDMSSGLSYDMAQVNPFGNVDDTFDNYLSNGISDFDASAGGTGAVDGGFDFSRMWNNGNADGMSEANLPPPTLNTRVFDVMKRGTGI